MKLKTTEMLRRLSRRDEKGGGVVDPQNGGFLEGRRFESGEISCELPLSTVLCLSFCTCYHSRRGLSLPLSSRVLPVSSIIRKSFVM